MHLSEYQMIQKLRDIQRAVDDALYVLRMYEDETIRREALDAVVRAAQDAKELVR